MRFKTLEQYNEALKELIFELGLIDLHAEAERLNRLVFEGGTSLHDTMRDLAPLLRDLRVRVPPSHRERVGGFESFARNHRRILGI